MIGNIIFGSVMALIIVWMIVYYSHFKYFTKDEGENAVHPVAVTMLTIVVLALFFVCAFDIGSRHGQKRALKGQSRYEMHLLYMDNDTIPVDTMFIDTMKP